MSKNKSRIKVALPVIATRADAETAMNELALTENNKRSFLADRDAEVLAINSKYEANLAACDIAIEEKTEALRVWAQTHPDEFPKGRKSLDLVCGTLGFRTGTPKLALLNRSWNWQTVTEAVGRLIPNFIRNTPEVDKEAIINQRADLAAILPRVGVKVTQGESFFIEPKLSNTDARQTKAAA